MTDLERVEVDLTLKIGIDNDPYEGLGNAIKLAMEKLGDMSLFVTSASVVRVSNSSFGGMLTNIEIPTRIKSLVKSGLCTDGGHHKQWFLEEVLKLLGYKIEDIRKELDEEGYYAEEGVIP